MRFRAPDFTDGARTRFTDAIRGELEHEANRNDAVILKSSDQTPRLPTYHFAHAVDDHLMRVTLAQVVGLPRGVRLLLPAHAVGRDEVLRRLRRLLG